MASVCKAENIKSPIPTRPDDVSLDLQEPLEVLEPLHLVVQVAERGLLALQDLVDGAPLAGVLGLRLYFLQPEWSKLIGLSLNLYGISVASMHGEDLL